MTLERKVCKLSVLTLELNRFEQIIPIRKWSGAVRNNIALLAVTIVAGVAVSTIFAYYYFETAIPATSTGAGRTVVSQQNASMPVFNQQNATQTPAEWRDVMIRAQPPKAGCFEAKYPDMELKEVPCAPPSSIPPHPPPSTVKPNASTTNNATATALPVFSQLNISAIDKGIEFTVKLNATQLEIGQPIKMKYAIRNLLPTTINVTATSNWPVRDWWKSNPTCYFVSNWIFQGYYTKSNISLAIPLQLTDPNVIVPCPAIDYWFPPVEHYRSSNGTLYLVLKPHSEKTGYLGGMSGYYIKSGRHENRVSEYDLVPFTKGVYTVAAGTGWGQLVILHFSVK